MAAHSTSTTLLAQIRQPSAHAAWARLVDLYTPLLQSWARRRCKVAVDADVNDLVQQVFVTLVQKLPEFHYDPSRSFRAWLWTIMHHEWIDQLRRQRTNLRADAALPEHLADDSEALWEAEYRQYLVRRALELMQADFEPATCKAYWEVAVGGRPAAQVAQELGLTVGAVHSARYRVHCRLRQELEGLLD